MYEKYVISQPVETFDYLYHDKPDSPCCLKEQLYCLAHNTGRSVVSPWSPVKRRPMLEQRVKKNRTDGGLNYTGSENDR